MHRVKLLILYKKMSQVYLDLFWNFYYNRYEFATRITGKVYKVYTYIRVVPKKNLSNEKGQMKECCPLVWFIFFLKLMVDFSFSIKVFKKQRGTLGWIKIWKKNRFLCLLPQKNALKNTDWKWIQFLKILIFVEIKIYSFWAIMGILCLFWYFLVHTFHKNQYF